MNYQEWRRWQTILRDLTMARDTLVTAAEDHASFAGDEEKINDREAVAALARLGNRHANYRDAVSATLRFADAHEWEGWSGFEPVPAFLRCFNPTTGVYTVPDGTVVDVAETITRERL